MSISVPTCFSTTVIRILALVGLCIEAVGCGGNSSVSLISQLQSPSVEVRRTAVRAIQQQPQLDPQLVAPLAKCVADSDAEVRRLAIDALAKFNSTEAAPAIPALEAALQDSENVVRIKAALTLAKIAPQNQNFVPVLATAMRAGDGPILLQVGAMGSQSAWAVPTLVGLLSHESPKMRALAAQTLGRIGPGAVEAKPALQRATRDSSAAVQTAAETALARIQSPGTGK